MKNKLKPILILSIILFLCFTGINIYMAYVNIKNTVEESIGERTLSAATSIAESFDIDTYQRFLLDKDQDENYWKIRNDLRDANDKIGALFVYTLEIDNPEVSHVMIAGLPEDTDMEYYTGMVCTVPPDKVKLAYEGKKYITNSIYDPNYDVNYISVGAPITDQSGQIIGYLGIDVSIDTLNETKSEVLQNSLAIFGFNGLFVLIVVLSFLFLQRWYQRTVESEVAATEDTYQSEIKGLIASVYSVRHDFSNHVQVLHGLLKIGRYEQALEYATSLSSEVKSIDSLQLDVQHPGLSVLLQTKKLSAQNYQVDMQLNVSDSKFEGIKTIDLIKILSNLIDNAMEATLELPEDNRCVRISCYSKEEKYFFSVMNTGSKIKDTTRIFIQGFSTKERKGKERGQGLFIVKEIVHQYGGPLRLHLLMRKLCSK
ncbi:GHKL domain-containing protein [Mangrovibacillus cuniculi]|uniref:GHKL domain-containing protein n=1 Tax=Mangrovibacillus cuniculi TaxID=2593652 RepID=A0A7S8HGD6_9BACI|nr:GHKL domain-containing protein [Mangrovibacillus cuniculi]QPC47884.1 GHKL domain-containing protein [Mangrovibacillus cuniculi]